MSKVIKKPRFVLNFNVIAKRTDISRLSTNKRHTYANYRNLFSKTIRNLRLSNGLKKCIIKSFL